MFEEFHVQQLNGSDNQGSNCGVAALATQIRIMTHGRLRPGPEQLRSLINDAVDYEGLIGTQIKEAYYDYVTPRWKQAWGKIPPFRLHQNDEYEDFDSMLERGFTAHVQLQYSGVPHPYRRKTSTFQGPHAVLAIRRSRTNKGVKGYLISDPLKGEPIFWPEEVLRKASFIRSGRGYIDAAYLPRDMENRPGPLNPPVPEPEPDPDLPPPEGGVDELPVPDPEPEPTEVEILKAQIQAADELISELRSDAGEMRETLQILADRAIP